jgi:hypothetical protein
MKVGFRDAIRADYPEFAAKLRGKEIAKGKAADILTVPDRNTISC